jgi:ubiquinone/menaquinone biosynthesis C-methylase UbiE
MEVDDGDRLDMSNRHDDVTEVIRHHWDRRATSFDDVPGHGVLGEEQRNAWLDVLSRLAGREPQRVLDVGCGTGFLALLLAELSHTVSGIDLSPQMIDRARRKAQQADRQIDFRVCDAGALVFADETFDVVVARHVIWNLPDPERGVAEWLRVLRPGGRLALIEGKWADNDALARNNSRPTSRLLTRGLDSAVALLLRTGRTPRRLLNRRYQRIEVQLPFSGGLSATRLADFLGANSVHDVEVESLMDPALWGELPQFPRYLATGTRQRDSVPGQ